MKVLSVFVLLPILFTMAAVSGAPAEIPKKSIGAQDLPGFVRYPGSILVYEENNNVPGEIWGARAYLTTDPLQKIADFYNEKLDRSGWFVNAYEKTKDGAIVWTLFRPSNGVMIRAQLEISLDFEYPEAIRIWFERGEEGLPREFPTMFEDLEEKRHAVLEGVYFPLNAAQYLPESEAALNALAQFLVKPPEMEIEIHGHTDSRGPAENNKKFSRLRADAIKKALEQRGVDGTRIRAEGFGPRDPIADNEDPAGREKNRRIEIFLFPKEGASAGGEAKNL